VKFSDHKNIISVIFGLDPDEVFFIRNCYKKLAKEIFSNKHNQNRVLLSGTPGIGKTLFGLYWIWYLLHQPPANRDIV
jgi:DNA replication protein DnaC